MRILCLLDREPSDASVQKEASDLPALPICTSVIVLFLGSSWIGEDICFEISEHGFSEVVELKRFRLQSSNIAWLLKSEEVGALKRSA